MDIVKKLSVLADAAKYDASCSSSGSKNKRAGKGIFVTTSTFTSSAIQTAKELGGRIVLIDGMQLARLMVRYNVGCREEEVLSLKRLDEDFFEV